MENILFWYIGPNGAEMEIKFKKQQDSKGFQSQRLLEIWQFMIIDLRPWLTYDLHMTYSNIYDKHQIQIILYILN